MRIFYLPLCRRHDYASFMEDTGLALVIVVTGAIVIALGRRWYRRRLAAKLADQVLEDVLKDKDAFRR